MVDTSEFTPRRIHFAVVSILIIFLFLICTSVRISEGEAPETRLVMTPAVNVAKEIGQVFDVAINVGDAHDLCAAKFTVTYNSSLLDVEQVTQGTFFPQQPNSNFGFEKNRTLGFVNVDISLRDVRNPLSGDGTLVYVRFKVVYGPEGFVNCPLNFEQTSLLDRASVQIEHDCVGAIYFWKDVQPDPPIGGRLLDLYTQIGGKGPDQFGGGFALGSLVNLTSLVTYNDYPVQQKLVGLEVHNPLNQIVVLRTAVTNEDGLAVVGVVIPLLLDNVGTWSAIATVDVAGITTWDTLTFNVSSHLPVGGFSTTTRNYTSAKSLQPCTLAILMLTMILVSLKRKIPK
jgi:hypothetical protein